MGLFKKKEKKTGGKGAGSSNFYFLLHNIISLPTFFFIAIVLHLTNYIPTTLNELFSLKFLQFFGIVLILNYLVGFLSRLFAYGLLVLFYDWDNTKISKRKKEIPAFLDLLNDGTIGFLSWPYFILMFLSTIAFTLSVAQIIQYKIFKDDSFLAVIFSYLIIKLTLGIYVYFKYK